MAQSQTPDSSSRRQALQLGGAVAAAMALPALRDSTTRLPNHPPPQLPFAPATPPPVPPAGVIALNRLAFGPRPGNLAAFNALGATDAARLQTYVDQQLNPSAIDDSTCNARIAAMNFVTLGKTLPQLWNDYYVPSNVDRSIPVKEVRNAALIRQAYSQRQFYEALVDFWHNHFSVYAWDYSYASATWASYDRDVIRPNVLGNFRQMLEAVATSTAMLYYLDNYGNQVAGSNENYGRELCELHTLGAENYLGALTDPTTVPKDGNGIAIGYVDNDVYEVARCFTGWRVNNGSNGTTGNDGTFQYYATWHDRFNKLVLGKYFLADQAAQKDGRDVLDILAAHPGVGRFIARKLCRRLVGDNPPQSLVDSIAALFTAQWNAPDQLKQVVRAIVLSPEFSSTWGDKIKTPHEIAVSLLRAASADFTPTDSFHNYYNAMGQTMFSRRPPDGYPDVKDAWTNTTSMLYRWRMTYYLMNGSITGATVNLASQMPGSYTTPTAIADFWIDRLLGRAMFPATNRTEVIAFLAQGADPNTPLNSALITERLPRVVEVILDSPDFQWR